jgi:hypothetical protein
LRWRSFGKTLQLLKDTSVSNRLLWHPAKVKTPMECLQAEIKDLTSDETNKEKKNENQTIEQTSWCGSIHVEHHRL